jgi:hypothetical protein
MQNRPTKRYMAAYGALYGDGTPMPPAKPKIKRNNDEDHEQMRFNMWFDKFLWKKGCRWFHPPNGGGRTMTEGVKLKAMGVKRGVPDIIVPMSRKGRHGLVIELKRVDGVASDVRSEQKEWLTWFGEQGWETHVCFGFEAAKKVVEAYFA